jgi:hypothetical protein
MKRGKMYPKNEENQTELDQTKKLEGEPGRRCREETMDAIQK